MAFTLHSADELTALSNRIFIAAGWTTAEAEATSRHLVLANLTGHDSHGVGMIPGYIGSWKDGWLTPSNQPEITSSAPPFLTIDAHVALGPSVARFATEQAIAMARSGGAAIVNLINAHHIGRIGTYAEMAAAEGLVSMFWVNVAGRPSSVAPFGARESRFGTNPHAIGIPNGETPLILDFATSRMAHGKARVAFNKGERVPDGYLIDEAGNPTTDPGVVMGDRVGALLPFGDHKGAGIALMAELLSAALAGGHTVNTTENRSWIINNLFGIVFDPDRLGGADGRAARIAALADYQRSAAPQPGVDKVRSPGDREREVKAERERNGIPVDAETWRQLMWAAEVTGAKA